MARYLANKCSIASRIDCFMGEDDLGIKEHISLTFLRTINLLEEFILYLSILIFILQNKIPISLERNSMSKLKRDLNSMTRVLLLVKTLTL